MILGSPSSLGQQGFAGGKAGKDGSTFPQHHSFRCGYHIQVPVRSGLLSGPESISGTHAGPYKMRHQGSQDTHCKATIPQPCCKKAVLTGSQKLHCDSAHLHAPALREQPCLWSRLMASSCLLSLTVAPLLSSQAAGTKESLQCSRGPWLPLPIPGLPYHPPLVPFPSPIISPSPRAAREMKV